MKRIFFIIIALIIIKFLNAQTQLNTSDGTPIYYNQSAIITSLPKQKTPPVGSVYFNDQWKNATMLLNDSTKLTKIKVKYNMLTKKFEIKQQNDPNIYTIYFSRVKKVIFKDNNNNITMINSLPYIIEYPDLIQGYDFLIVHTKGKITLLEGIKLDKLYANYNTALDVGSTSDKYVKKTAFFIEKQNKLYQFYPTKSYVLKFTKDKKDLIKKFVKQHKLSYRKINDITQIFNYYNSLTDEKN